MDTAGEMANLPPLPGADVFISYSTQDKLIVKRLYESLRHQGRVPWIDWRDIAPSVDWLEHVHSAIDAAQVFLFVISPHSLRSRVAVLDELSHALAANKKIVAVLVQAFRDSDIPGPHREIVRKLLKLQHIPLLAEDPYQVGLAKLLEALDTDYPHTRFHTAYLWLARTWSQSCRDSSQLLRGQALQQAERWLRQIGSKQEPANELQIAFIEESRTAEQERLRLAKVRLKDTYRALAASNFSNFKLLRERDPQQALAHLVKAIRMEPSRRNFHDILFDALTRTSYALAISPLISFETNVEHVAFANDGKCFMAATDKQLQVWTLVDGSARLLRKVILPEKIADAAFSPDGSALLISTAESLRKVPLGALGKEKSVPLEGFKVGEAIRILSPFERSAHIVLFNDNKFQVWNWASMSAVTLVLKSGEKIGLAQFRGTSQFCFGMESTSKDKQHTLQLFGVDGNLKAKVPVTFPHEPGDDVSTDPEFRTFAAETFPQELSIWLPNGDLYVEKIHFPSRIFPPVFSSSAQIMAVAETRGFVRVIDFHRKRDLVAPIRARPVLGNGLRFAPDGRSLLIADGKTARLWDVRNSIATGELALYPEEFANDFEVLGSTQDGSLIITRSPSTKAASIIDSTGRKGSHLKSYRLNSKEPCVSAAISSNGKFAALATSNSLILYERNQFGYGQVMTLGLMPSPGGAILRFSDHEEKLVAVTTTQTADGPSFAEKRYSSKLRRFDLRKREVTHESDGIEGAIIEMYLTRDGNRVAFKRHINTPNSIMTQVSVYDFVEQKMSEYPNYESLQISPSGEIMFLAGKTASLVELESGRARSLAIPHGDAFWLEARFGRDAKSLYVRAAGAIPFQALGWLDVYMRINSASGELFGTSMISTPGYGTSPGEMLGRIGKSEPVPPYPWTVSADECYLYQHANNVVEVWNIESGDHLLPPMYFNGGLKPVVFGQGQETRKITCLAHSAAVFVDVCGTYDTDAALALCDFVEAWCGWTINKDGFPREREILERNTLLSQLRKSGDAGRLMNWFADERSTRSASPYSECSSSSAQAVPVETMLNLVRRPGYDENPAETSRAREAKIKRMLESGGIFAAEPAP